MIPERCPTCGSVVEVVTADEGTSYFRPVDSTRPHQLTDEMVEAAARALWDHRAFDDRRWCAFSDDDGTPDESPLWAEVVERGIWPASQRDVRAEARAALEAVLGGAA